MPPPTPNPPPNDLYNIKEDVQWKALVSPPSRPNLRQFRPLRNTHLPPPSYSHTNPTVPSPPTYPPPTLTQA